MPLDDDQMMTLSRCELNEMMVGAARLALAEVGLGDPKAVEDIKKVRSLLAAWNMAQASFWKAVWDKIGMMAAGAFLLWLAAKFTGHSGG